MKEEDVKYLKGLMDLKETKDFTDLALKELEEIKCLKDLNKEVKILNDMKG